MSIAALKAKTRQKTNLSGNSNEFSLSGRRHVRSSSSNTSTNLTHRTYTHKEIFPKKSSQYSEYVKDYTAKDIKIVFDYFDTVIVGSHSRNTTYTGSYGVNGGTRQAYLDYPVSGGTGVSGIFNFKDNDY